MVNVMVIAKDMLRGCVVKMDNEIKMCKECGVYYNNNIDGLEEHYFGDGMGAREHTRVTHLKIDADRRLRKPWWVFW